MKRSARIACITAGTAAVAASVAALISTTITRTLVGEALDRSGSFLLKNKKHLISGSIKDAETLRRAQENAARLAQVEMKQIEIISRDGVSLIGHWYPCENAERIIVAMHGWRSSWTWDFGSISSFWHDRKCSVLYVEQRGQGASGGSYMGFGMIERYDCLDWVNWVCENVPDSTPIYLAGISMGAATVMMAADLPLPERVHGIMADCGFTSAKAIWKHVTEDNLHLSYRFREKYVDALCRRRIRCGAGEISTVKALANTHVPLLFFHGTADTFVPVSMTMENYEACASPKMLHIVEGAGHGMSYFLDPEGYQKATLDFWNRFDGNAAVAPGKDSE